MTTYRVTMRTGDSVWSIIELPASNHAEAVATAQRLIGGQFVSVE
jgi:hypothetical protein